VRRYKYILALLLPAILSLSIPAAGVSTNNKGKYCPVHHVLLKKEKLKILYGLVLLPCDTLDRVKVAATYFPYANSVAYGGCVIEPDSPEYEEVLYCAKCREVEREAESWPCLETRDTPIITTLPTPTITPLLTPVIAKPPRIQ
jgi:hypothetical protein